MGETSTRRPCVSVIIVFYDSARFLSEAIDSVLAQDFRDFELILVDDGSSDGGSEIAARYGRIHSSRIRCFASPAGTNCGISVARNHGLDSARGEFVAFLDADDRWYRQKLTEQLEIFEAFPDVDAVCGSVNYWRSWEGGADQIIATGHLRNTAVAPPDASLAWYPLGVAHAPSMSDLLIRTAAIRAVNGFEPRFRSAYEDQAFLAKLYLQSTLFVSGRVWSDYRLHDGSCMAQVTREGRYREVRADFLEWFERYLASTPEKQYSAVTAALDRSLLPYRHPAFARRIRLAGKLLRRLQRA